MCIRDSVLEARLSVVGRPGSTSWCIPMRFYKVFDAITGPMGLKAKKHYFSNRISVNFVFPGHTELLPGHAPWCLGGPTGRLEGWTRRSCVLLNGLGRVQKVLGTFQGAPERESLIFHWFWKVFEGVAPRTRHAGAVWLRPPKLKENTKHTWG